MAKETIEEIVDRHGLTVNDGIRFGLGFFIVTMGGFAAIGLVSWALVLITRSLGLSF